MEGAAIRTHFPDIFRKLQIQSDALLGRELT